ncbi:hypothetical protein GCM10027404_18390 [Arthrobacter tumbae]|uniref:hypothetical protein n=1 Tax=Arthrobacter tumbae TaxID=163874 RepID=UPI0019599DBA|nr:hypothetical protein [Arthrobacter tumbae]MBM7780884.1 hypothetical protein [Arthrobacter tumbae]
MGRPRLVSAAAATVVALLGSTLFAMPASAEAPEPRVDDTVRSTPEPTATDQFIVKFKETAGTAAAHGKAYGLTAKELGVSVKELRGMSTGAKVVQTGRDWTQPQPKNSSPTWKQILPSTTSRRTP